MTSALAQITPALLAELDTALHGVVERLKDDGEVGLWRMACYAMGWSEDGAHNAAAGKRLRPLMTLLICGASGEDWRSALPAACSVELIHCFSLVHDDIQDCSETRRGRPALWKVVGTPRAINVGDALFAIALSSLGTARHPSACSMFNHLAATCIRLTQGQHLDLSYETAEDIRLPQYARMVEGKTAALVETACRLGAMSAGAPEQRVDAFRAFGRALGAAFQMQDDFLGVWGDPAVTGKSAAGDLLARKKSLPILYGMQQSPAFRKALAEPDPSSRLPDLLRLLDECGAREFTLREASAAAEQAFAALEQAAPGGDFGAALHELAAKLNRREK